jgi:hypothetical protein
MDENKKDETAVDSWEDLLEDDQDDTFKKVRNW